MEEPYLSIQKAAKIMELTVQALYQAAQRRVLKTKKVNGRIYTTLSWIREYETALHSRQEHATYNGKPVFNPEKGEYSIIQAAEILGINADNLYWYMRIGKFKAIRRGYYWVITEDQLQQAQDFLKEKMA